MSVEGRELGWDDSIKQDSQNFDRVLYCTRTRP